MLATTFTSLSDQAVSKTRSPAFLSIMTLLPGGAYMDTYCNLFGLAEGVVDLQLDLPLQVPSCRK